MMSDWDGVDRRDENGTVYPNIPRPDPSSRSVAALNREIESLRELLETRIEGAVAVINSHLDHIQSQFVEMDRRLDQRHEAAQHAIRIEHQASERAITKAEISIEKRSDATYVAIGELERLQKDLLPRAEADAKIKGLAEKGAENARRLDKMEGASTGMEKSWGLLVAVVMLAAAVVAIVVAFN